MKLSVALALAVAGAAFGRGARADVIKITILHVNDLHGYVLPREFLGPELPPEHLGQQVGSLFSAATRVAELRNGEKPGPDGDDGILFLDGGDLYSGTLDDFNSEGGNAVRALLSPALDVDVSVVGNHAWDFGPDRFRAINRALAAHHPILAANLVRDEGGRPEDVGEYTLLTVRGVRIAVIGLITEGALRASRPDQTVGYSVTDEIASLERALGELAKLPGDLRPQVKIVLSHVAFERSSRTLDRIRAMDDVEPGDDRRTDLNIDLIIDGHSHRDLQMELDSNTLLVQADHYGVKLGEVELDFDRSTGALAGKPRARRHVLLSGNIPPHGGMLEELKDVIRVGRSENDRGVFETRGPVTLETLERTDLTHLDSRSGDLFTRAMLVRVPQVTGGVVDLALVNQTGVRAGLYSRRAGGITAGALHAISPFANNLEVVQVKAGDLLDFLRKDGIQHRSKMSWAGLAVVASQKGSGEGAAMHRTLVSATVTEGPHAGKSLEALGDEPLTVACPEFVSGRELKSITVPGSRRALRITDREAIASYLERLAGAGGLSQESLEKEIGQPARLEMK